MPAQLFTVAHTTPSARTRIGPEDSPLSPYFRDISGVDVMTREQELTAANRLSSLRQAYWRALLAYPPFIEAICELALTLQTPPKTEINGMIKASRKLRDRDLRAHQDAYEQARIRLATAMATADPDGQISDIIFTDLGCIESGHTQALRLQVRSPRHGSVPFYNYLSAVRASQHALWLAKDAFVKANLRLVITIARRFNHGRLPFQDLIQEGNIGLMKAVDRFDPTKGFRFSTYATWWIRHAVTRAIADKARAVRLPVHMLEACHKLARARRTFETKHGRPPTNKELASATEISVERIQRMQRAIIDTPISLDQPLASDTNLSLVDAIEDIDDIPPGDRLDQALLLENLREVFSTLSSMEADILRKRTGLDDNEELTLKQIGARYSLSRERIRQVQEQALGKLRDEFQRRALL